MIGFGDPHIDRMYDKWRTASPYDDYDPYNDWDEEYEKAVDEDYDSLDD